MRSVEELTAYAAFLLSEKLRHIDDITMIDRKLALLEKRGIKVEKPGDWIGEDEL